MPVRTGKQFIDGLRQRPREVWLRGKRVEDPTTHPAFRRPVERLAHLYDMQHDPVHAGILTYPSPTTGDPVGTAFMAPRTLADLVKRRNAFQLWAEATFGLMGRSPDFMNTVLLAFAEAKDVFARDGQRYADNLVRYYEHVRENDLFLSHALISPQTDRSKSSFEQVDPHLHMGVLRETPEGLIIRGARMLATMGPICDEMLIYNLPGLRPGDEAHAVAFAVPINAPGLRQICREPYNWGDRSDYDHPLAANFEECDSVLIFDDVLVPWERVFIYNNVKLANALYPDTALRNHTAHQTNVRALVKMRFAVGIAQAIARAVKADQFLHVQEKLGECMSYVELIKSAIVRAEVEHDTVASGNVRTTLAPLQALRGLLPTFYPRVIEVLQLIGAGGLLMTPTAADFNAPDIAGDVARFYQGAEGLASVDRVRLFKLAWDLAGDSFGARQLQYERFYAGDPVRILAMTYLGSNDRQYQELVESAIAIAGNP
ncbi:MAG: 4-hydroxyphenylacetate 3-monooxygenase, oxygenase component [Burkholderiales bacterium]